MVRLENVSASDSMITGVVWNENPARSLDYTVWYGHTWQTQLGERILASGHLGPGERASFSYANPESVARVTEMRCAAVVQGETYSPFFGPITVSVPANAMAPVPAYTMDRPWIEAVRDLPIEQKTAIVELYQALDVAPSEVMLIGGAPVVERGGELYSLPPSILPEVTTHPSILPDGVVTTLPSSASAGPLLLVALAAYLVMR